MSKKWGDGWVMNWTGLDTAQTVMTSRAPVVLKTEYILCFFYFVLQFHLKQRCNIISLTVCLKTLGSNRLKMYFQMYPLVSSEPEKVDYEQHYPLVEDLKILLIQHAYFLFCRRGGSTDIDYIGNNQDNCISNNHHSDSK